MRSSKHRYIFILFVLAVLLITLLIIVSPALNSRFYNGVSAKCDEGWMMETPGGVLVPFDSFGKEIDSERIVLVRDLDTIPENMDSIGFYNYYSAVDVYIDEILIYQYGTLHDIDSNNLLGNFYSMVHVHNRKETGSTLRLVFKSRHPQTVYGINIGSGSALEIAMIREYITTLVTPVIALMFLVLSILFNRQDPTQEYITKSHLWLLLFNLNISVWEMADSQLLIDVGFPAGKVCLLSFESYMLLPLTLSMFIYYSCKKYRKACIVLADVSFVNFVVLNVLNYTGIESFLYTLLPTHIIVAVTMLVSLGLVISEYLRKKTRHNVYLALGFIIFFVCAFIQYANFFVNPSNSNSSVLQFGSSVFILMQIANVLGSVNIRMNQVSTQLSARNKLLEKTFGSFIPDEMVQSILENPDDFALSGDTKQLSILQSDIRGFSELLPEMSAKDAIIMLNHYLETMTIAIKRHGGTIMGFVGDGIMATFDSKGPDDNNADKAIFAALEMQNMMPDIHEWNRSHGYPEFEMGIGINTGDAYVGYIGSTGKLKYDAIGSNVNLASRIESYSTGGQILISESCMEATKLRLNIASKFSVLPKGSGSELVLYLVGGIGSPYNIECKYQIDNPEPLEVPIDISFYTIENKHCGSESYAGRITGLSKTHATLETNCPLMIFDNIRINSRGAVSCKVVSRSGNGFLLRFTSIPKKYEEWSRESKTKAGDTDGK